MWRPCDTVLDKPAKLWLFELPDVGCFLAITLVGGMMFDLIACLLGGGLAAFALYRLRRGTPAGFLLHTLHRLGLVRLPGVLSRHATRWKVW